MQRYARQMILPELGSRGQEKLGNARVLCVGAGGLGSPAALYLAAAGVGCLGIVDSDAVELSNLHRQILHSTLDVGRAKSVVAEERLRALNPEVAVESHRERLTRHNALDLIGSYDLVLDGTDNLVTRYLVNDACVFLGKANFYGAVLRFEGQASVFAPHRNGPCYRCLFPEPPPPGAAPTCVEAGVLGVVPGIIGLLQATEALKWILGAGESLLGRLLLFDALTARFREIRVQRDPRCPVCGPHPTITELTEAAYECAAPPSAEALAPGPDEVSVEAMRLALADPARGIQVLDIREPYERELASVEGTRFLPLSALAERLPELDPEQPYYLHCHLGVRSLQAVRFLQQHGFQNVKSVRGGIEAWIRNEKAPAGSDDPTGAL